MQLSRKEILEKLQDIMISINDRDRKKIEASTEETRLVEDIGLTSVGTLYLAVVLEESFQIKFEDIGMSTFDTVGRVIDYIEERLK